MADNRLLRRCLGWAMDTLACCWMVLALIADDALTSPPSLPVVALVIVRSLYCTYAVWIYLMHTPSPLFLASAEVATVRLWAG